MARFRLEKLRLPYVRANMARYRKVWVDQV